jgi:LPXTG-motif cell wall-anchored protein
MLILHGTFRIRVGAAEMPETGTDWLDTLLFGGLVLFVGAAALVVFVRAVEAWRHWSENRKLRRHFREN